MGFTPQEVDAMTIYQFSCAAHGFKEAHRSSSDGKLPPVESYSENNLALAGIEGFKPDW